MGSKKTSSLADREADVGTDPPDSPQTAKVFIDNRGLLETYLRRRLRSPEDTEDYVQEVYCKVLAMDREQRSRVKDWRGFLTRIASNVVIDHFRRGRTRQTDMHVELEEQLAILDEHAFDPERLTISRDDLAQVEATLSQLDDLGRRALIAARVHGLSHAEIAEELGLTTKRVGHLIERTLRQLAREIAREGDD